MSQQAEKIQVSEEEEVEIDLIELLYYFRSKIVIIIVTFLLGALAVGLFTYYLITPKYTATSKLYMVSASSDSIVDLTDLNLGTSLSSDYEELLKIRPIIEAIIEEENLDYTYEELLDMITISTITDTRILTISVESTNPSEAKVVANALANKAVSNLPKLMDTTKPNIAEHAIRPEEQSSPNLALNTIIGAVGAMLFVMGILLFLFITDDTLNSAEDVEKYFGIMPLTVIPEGIMESISDKAEKETKKKKQSKKQKRRKRNGS